MELHLGISPKHKPKEYACGNNKSDLIHISFHIGSRVKLGQVRRGFCGILPLN
jgi:hypothetical protein